MSSQTIRIPGGVSSDQPGPSLDTLHEDRKRQEAAGAARNLKHLYDEVTQGRAPPNSDLAAAIQRLEVLLQDEETKNPRLTDKGRLFTQDMRQLLEASKQILLQKNSDDKIQNFLLHSAVAAKQLSDQARAAPSSTDPEAAAAMTQAKDHLRKTVFHGRKVLLLLARSPEFRSAVSTFLDVSKRLLSTEEGREAAVKSVSQASEQVRGAIGVAPAEAEEEETEEEEEEEEEEGFEEEEEEEIAQEFAQAYSVYPEGVVPASVAVVEEESRGVRSALAKPSVVPAKSSQAPSQPSSKGKFLITRKFEEEVDEETRHRLQSDVFRVLEQLSSNEDHRNAVESLFNLLSLVSTAGWKAGSTQLKGIKKPDAVDVAVQEGKDVVEHFIGVGKVDPLLTHFRSLAAVFRADADVSLLLTKIRNYIQTALREPQLLKQKWFLKKGSKYIDRMGTLGERYRNHPDLVFVLDESRSIMDTIRRDDSLNNFAAAVNQLSNDLVSVDAQGKRRFDPEMIQQIKAIAIPLLVEQLHYIPLPPMSGSSPVYDWAVENVVLSSYDILPEHIFIDTSTHTDVKPLSDQQHESIDLALERGRHTDTSGEIAPRRAYRRHHKYTAYMKRQFWPRQEKMARAATSIEPDDKIATNYPGPVLSPTGHTRTTGQLVIRAYNVHFNLKDVKFSFARKKWPRIKDNGYANVATKGLTGGKVVIRLDMASDNMQQSLFTGGAVTVKIAPLGIRFHDNKHKFLLNTLGKLSSRAIRKKTEQEIAARLKGVITRLIEALNDTVRRTPNAADKFRSLIRGGFSSAKNAAVQMATKAAGSAASAVGGEEAPVVQ